MKIIYDEALAIKEKAETDAYNRRLRRPVIIFACITAGILLLAITTKILSNVNLIDSAYSEVAIVITAFFAVALLILWHTKSSQEIPYSANVQYYVATKGKTVRHISITPETRFTMEQLCVSVEDQNGKEKEIFIEIFNMGVKKGISEDIVDLCVDFPEGHWYESFDKKAKELESLIVDTEGDNESEE